MFFMGIAERIMEQNTKTAYPYEKENEVIDLVQSCCLEKSLKAVDALLEKILLYAGGDLGTVKIRLLEFIALLSRSAVDFGASVPSLNLIMESFFVKILESTDFKRIVLLSRGAVSDFIKKAFAESCRGQLNEHLSKAVKYIRINYSKALSLQEVADATFVSAYYLSHLFRGEMGITFSEYVCKIKIEKAKDILKKDKLIRITEVADRIGFNDPNYFAKKFKKLTGFTPKIYRGMYHLRQEVRSFNN
jgi:YesN/AraC family two-component response regulator